MTGRKDHDSSGVWVPRGSEHDRAIDLLRDIGFVEFRTPEVRLPPAPEWAQTIHRNWKEACSIVGRLGLPKTSVYNKSPYMEESEKEVKPGTVKCTYLPGNVKAVAGARDSGAIFKEENMPHHHANNVSALGYSPGVGAVLAINVLICYILST